ncbi:hypothetical protein CEP52_016471 [Fusarium oligoseptatum]|uniref:Uncharacterized protein n=2 Tax=Fusarium solani species complex TaxID=232080 RepID=A0A428S3C0_9HYPO|nr:hypothetical protein CEP51_014711 [Fusarium floridanum]RSL84320.1 hypothetical protein CEP52_016471 [Fusarium oligoseptatum]
MHFNAVAGFALSLVGSASALAAPKLPASGLCPNGQYWDTGKGCTASPPPQRCSSDQYYDSLKGCVKGTPPSGPPGLLCTIVKTLVKVARQDLQATSFCSSYLSIPVSTKSVTVTAYTTVTTTTSTITSGVTTTTDSTKTITDSTTTTTSTKTETTTTKTTTTSTITEVIGYTTITACASPVGRKVKRYDDLEAHEERVRQDKLHHIEARGIAKPGAFANYADPAAVSYACNCFDIPQYTTTSVTTLRTKTVTTSVTVPSTERVTATATATATSTSTITEPATVYSETVTEKTTTSITQTVLKPTVSILAMGGWNNGHALYDLGDGTVGDDGPYGTTLLFTLGLDGTLKVTNGVRSGSNGQTDPNNYGSSSYVLFGFQGGALKDMTCTVTQKTDGSCPLTCQGTRGSTNFDCGVYWRLGSDADVQGCSVFTPYAVGSVGG